MQTAVFRLAEMLREPFYDMLVLGKRSVPRVGLLTVIVFARLSRAEFDASTIVVTVLTIGVAVYCKF
jgi:hypothetical protein